MKPQAKRLIIISVLALGGAAIWYFFIKGKPPKGNNQNTGNASDTRTNWSEGQAINIAQNLLDAMARIGTNEKEVIGNLELAFTKSDLLLIMSKFITLEKAKGESLNTWLKSELSGSDLSKAKAIFDKLDVPF